MRVFVLPNARVEFHDWGARTVLLDGSEVPAVPQDNDEYRERAAHLGYGWNPLAMCQDHELLHSVAAELLHGEPSEVMWRIAHGDTSKRGLGAEEDMVLRLQRELRRS